MWQVTHSTNHYPFWYTVILYDTAGEANDAKAIERELRAIDKVAVVINANAEPDNGTAADSSFNEQSLLTACHRIINCVDNKQKLYLVVTQMDRIRGSPSSCTPLYTIGPATSATAKPKNSQYKTQLYKIAIRD